MCGSGKSVVADVFVAHGYQFLRFGQITMEEIKRRNLEVSEANERAVREGFRKEHGMGAYAILNIPKIEELLKHGPVIVDGLYSWSEYKVLKENYGDRFITIAIYAPPKTRYARLDTRVNMKEDTALRNRRFSPEQAKARDCAEIENIEKGGPIAMADYTITNDGTLDELKTRTETLVKILER